MSAERNTTRLLVGHGSRSAVAQAEFAAFVAAYQERHPQDYVECAHLELAEPRLPAALAAAAQRSRRVVVLLLFLFAAGHVKNDLPVAFAVCQRDFPGVEFVIGGAYPFTPPFRLCALVH